MPIAPDTYRKVVAAKVYIDGNFNGPLDLDRLSREACLSRYHFHRLFTRIYKVTPHQYLTRKRIEQARLCLAARDLTVTEICNHVGFESIGSFSLLFKKEIGAAPTSYRDEAWRREQQTLAQPRSFIPHCFIENCGVDRAAGSAAPGSDPGSAASGPAPTDAATSDDPGCPGQSAPSTPSQKSNSQ